MKPDLVQVPSCLLYTSVVNEQLIAPGTAIYSGEEILEKDDYGRYLVYLDVDAENSYGAKVRSEWCVVVFSVTKDDFHYNNQASYVNSYSGTDVKSELAISTLKEFNDWDKPFFYQVKRRKYFY